MPSILSTSGFPRTARPAIYTRVDASALAGGAVDSGNIAIVGDFPTFPSLTPVLFSSRRAMVAYDPDDRELSMLAQLAFNPSADPLANRGASSVRVINSREDGVRASLDLGPLELTSTLYGARGNATRATLAISGDTHTLTLVRGGISETFEVEGTAVASITNDRALALDVTAEEGVITLEYNGSEILRITTNEAADLRAAIVLINQLEDISATLIEPRSIPLDELDYFTTSINNGVTYEIEATGQAMLSELVSSRLVTATIDTASTAGSFAQTTVYASGGSVGATIDTASALASIEAENVQIVVMHDFTEGRQTLLLEHLIASARAGYERQAYVAIEASASLANIRTRAAKLNSPEIALACQSIDLFDAGGQRVTRDARFTALMYAGMQAGSDIGEPLTRKRPNIISTTQNFDAHADIEQALRSGTIVIVQGPTGPRIERSITTYLEDNNPILSEVSAYESVIASLRDMRLALADQIGRPTKASQLALIESRVGARLAQQVRDGVIKAFGAVQLEDLGDQVAVSYDVAPLEPLNFITLTAIAQRIS